MGQNLVPGSDVWLARLSDAPPPRSTPVGLMAELEAAVKGPCSGTDGMPCVWLNRVTGRCRHYEFRPDVCREFEVGGEACLRYREKEGLDERQEETHMGLVQVRECDVFKTRRKVVKYRLALTCDFMGRTEVVWAYETHLSARAKRRLMGFVRRGLTPPDTGGEGETHEATGQESEPANTPGTAVAEVKAKDPRDRIGRSD